MPPGVIGYGAVAQSLIERLPSVKVGEAAVLVRSCGDVTSSPDGLRLKLVSTLDAFLAIMPVRSNGPTATRRRFRVMA